ncbi:hypothetical protein ACYT84_09250 [Ralstonia solanacearum]|uniref:hypothetical protein n=1 Tax=Ralstonia solanacearum TaxID=305 RepID=UPI0018D14346|nr:hypothetical protein [Ralstonia solanacearum]
MHPNAKNAQQNPLHSLVEAGQRALGFRDYGHGDDIRRMAQPAVASGTIDLSQFIADGNPAPNIYGVQERPAGETLPLDPRAVIEQHSRCAQAGARIVVATPRDKAIAIKDEKTDGLLGFYEDPQLLRVIDPATFQTLADGADATASAMPTHDAVFTWPSVPTAAFRTTITRAQNRQVGGGEDLRSALLDAILRGLGEYCDGLLLAAIAATTPAAFSFGAAAARHLKLEDLRGLVGTNGVGAAFRGDGAFVVNPGIPAELTASHAASFVGAFGTAAIALWPALDVHVRRMNADGDLDVICLANAQAVVADPSKFWTVAA